MKKVFYTSFMVMCSLTLINCAPQLEGEGSDTDGGTVTDGGETTDDAGGDPCNGEDDGSEDCEDGWYACDGTCYRGEEPEIPCNGEDDGSEECDEGWYACDGGCHRDPNVTDCGGVDDGSEDCPDGWYACEGGCIRDPDYVPDAGSGHDSGSGCNPNCGDSTVYIYAEANGGAPVDYMCLNAEFTTGSDADDFGGWAQLTSDHDTSYLEYEADLPYVNCVRFNTVTLNDGTENYLCYGYGADARLTADAEVHINGQRLPVQIVSVVWTEDGHTVYGCSAIACLGGNPPDNLDLH